MNRRRGRHFFLGRGEDDWLGEEKGRVFQNGRAVLVRRAAVMVASVGGFIRLRVGGRVGVIALSHALFQGGGFPVLKQMKEGKEAQQHNANSNQEQGAFGS